ncbi:MAG: nuclear transport factor 2 family protein [Solirubrobacterales bacterium]|nr:nuclear transport factor 2 family protein [Solirubrobacterales bacterium]
MPEENIEVVRRIFDGWAIGDLGAARDRFDEHIVFVVSREFPATGAVMGLEGVRGFVRNFLAQWERVSFEAKRLQAIGDTVLVTLVQRSTGRTSGLEAELAFFMLFTFRGGMIIRMESVMDENAALAAAGLTGRKL